MAQTGDNNALLQLPPAIMRIQRFVAAQANNRSWQTSLTSARGSIAQLALGTRLMRQFAGFGSQGAWSQEIFARFQSGEAQRDTSALPLARAGASPPTRTGRGAAITRMPAPIDTAWPPTPAEPASHTDTFATALRAQGWSLETPDAASSPGFEPSTRSVMPPARNSAPVVARTANASIQRQTERQPAVEALDRTAAGAEQTRLPDL
ncbi:MAG TPA: hypothetical protein VFX76_19150, partial [Roseiflexaceae bacterium]|nr:hypothetical protein [Roseiflexaceae bacterium]